MNNNTSTIISPQNTDCETLATDNTIEALAQLSPIEYGAIRKDEAKKLGVNLSTLDNLVKDARKNNGDESGSVFAEIEIWPEPVIPEELLPEIAEIIQRFIVCEPETALAATLWAAMTWFIDVVNVAPLAVITAPEKRCGKTQLLSILGKISCNPLLSSNISPAALYRAIEKWQPTLLIDEADAFVRNNEELRGLLNAGHTRDSAFTLRCVGDDHEPKKFNLWGAKALSGIGKLADTIMDRAIILELRRKLPNERIEKLRYAPEGMFETLQKKLARFAEDYRDIIKDARPDIPETLNDRAQDNWEPLLMIADTAGSDYGRLARESAIKLSGNNEDELSLNVQLLADILEIFETNQVDKIFSDDLIRLLCEDNEKPWATYNFFGRKLGSARITPKQLAKMLSDYGIKSGNMRGFINHNGLGGNPLKVKKGYRRSQFEDAFLRYLPLPIDAEIPATSATAP